MRAPTRRYRRAMSFRATLPLLALCGLGFACRHPRPASPSSARAIPSDAGAPRIAHEVAAPPEVAVAPTLQGAPPALSQTEPWEGGCIAWSPRRALAACLVGQSGWNLNDRTSWGVRVLGEPADPALSLVPVTDAGLLEDPHETPTPPAVVARLRARLASEGYVDLRPLRVALGPAALDWAPGSSVRWTHRDTFEGGDNAAARGTDLVEVRWQAGGPALTLTAWEDRPVAEPRLRAYIIPGGRHLVIEAVGVYGDEGEYGVHSLAWVCDREARVCQAP